MEVSIRKLHMKDAPAMADLLNNYNVRKNLPDMISYPYTAADAEEFISRVLCCESFSGNFAVETDGQFCGIVGEPRNLQQEAYSGGWALVRGTVLGKRHRNPGIGITC